MTLPPPPPPRCRCGAARDTRGLCTHCDVPPPVVGHRGLGPFRAAVRECPVGCVACRTRDSQCAVCRTHCGTPAAAIHHETACRAAEQARTTR